MEAALESRIRRRATEAIEVYEASYTKGATLSVVGGSGSGAQSAEPPPPCALAPAGAPIRRDLASLPPLSLPPKTALPRGVPLAAAAAAAATAPLSAGPVSLDATAIDAARQCGAQVRPPALDKTRSGSTLSPAAPRLYRSSIPLSSALRATSAKAQPPTPPLLTQVVLAASAFRELVTKLSSRACAIELPLRLRREPGCATLCYIDKPLPPPHLTARAKNDRFHAAALRSLLGGTGDDPAAGGVADGGAGERRRGYTYQAFELGDLTLLVRCKHDGLLGAPAQAGTPYATPARQAEEGEDAEGRTRCSLKASYLPPPPRPPFSPPLPGVHTVHTPSPRSHRAHPSPPPIAKATMEYWRPHAWETLAPAEHARRWAHLAVRPGAVLVVCNIDPLRQHLASGPHGETLATPGGAPGGGGESAGSLCHVQQYQHTPHCTASGLSNAPPNFQCAEVLAALAALLRQLLGLEAGGYVLRSSAGQARFGVWAAERPADASLLSAFSSRVAELPKAPNYALHDAMASAGAADTACHTYGYCL